MSFWQKGVNFAYFNQIKTCKSQIVMHLDLYEYIRVFILKCTESNLCWFVENWYVYNNYVYMYTLQNSSICFYEYNICKYVYRDYMIYMFLHS